MKILVINSGSSSIKYRLFDMAANTVVADGVLEKIGEETSRLVHNSYTNGKPVKKHEEEKPVAGHRNGLMRIVEILTSPEIGVVNKKSEIGGIGHRVVHGGEVFTGSVLIDEKVIDAVRDHIPLAPLHNPPNLTGIEVALEIFPDTPQVAVFDTAFHQTLPPKAFHYALPYEFYEKHRVRKYGFHGTSHFYLAKKAAEFIGKPLGETNLITIHLGNGASMSAVENGKCVDTSMGMTPLEGLVMGTRCGDIDPAIHFYLARQCGMSFEELDELFNHESGLKGICKSNDMRDILEKRSDGDRLADLAVQIYSYRIKKYIGAYTAVLGRVDAIVFAGGVGENSAEIRLLCCENMEPLGISMDKGNNDSYNEGIGNIGSDESKIRILVIPTDEELEIAGQTYELLENS